MKYSKFISIFIFCIYIFSCKNSNEDIFNGIFSSGELAQANIISVTDVHDTSAIVICALSNKGKGYISARGVCWYLTPNPTIENPHTATKDTGNIAMKLTKLSLGTTYYVRPYITNSVGTSYGTEFHFITKNIPTITTTSPTNITAVSATLSGNVTTDGGDSVTVRGVCWSTATKPTTALTTKTINGSGKGVFVSEITGITIGTTYYARTYATNAYGTVYSSEISFTTQNLPTLSTTAVSNITIETATSGGTITSDGGSAIIARGVCWSTSSTPTISNSKSSDGTGKGFFTSSITGLTAITQYYVRAYATNSLGTSYGAEVSFTSISSSGTITDIDNNVYHYITIGTQTWMVENLKTTKYNDGTTIPNVTDGTAWAALTSPAYCFYNNDVSTYKNIYGALYNWYAVNSGKLAPTGWHVATDAEWVTLTTLLGGEYNAGAKLKESGTMHWASPNNGATNESGFSALPTGFRGNNGTFPSNSLSNYGFWWSSTERDVNNAWGRTLYSEFSQVGRSPEYKTDGLSVRCIRN